MSQLHDALEVIDSVFEKTNADNTSPEPKYPEELLQQSQAGGKYIARCQRPGRQFIAGDGGIVQWKGCGVERLEKAVVEQCFIGGESRTARRPSTGFKAPAVASALFSWSSGDAYIQSRKEQLNRGRSISGSGSISESESGSGNGNGQRQLEENDEQNGQDNIITRVKMTLPDAKVLPHVSYVADTEANKFIHRRVQVIKEHHSAQMSEKINERKRKDHELHLQRLKQQEEEYERELRAATKEEKPGFFSLFGFGRKDEKEGEKKEKKKREKDKVIEDENSDHKDDSIDHKNDSHKDDFHKDDFHKDDSHKYNSVDQNIYHNDQDIDHPDQKPAKIHQSDLDLVFNSQSQSPQPSTQTSSHPPQLQPQLQPQPVTTHRFMKMAEPKPLINLDGD